MLTILCLTGMGGAILGLTGPIIAVLALTSGFTAFGALAQWCSYPGFYRCSSFSRRKLRLASSRPKIASTSAAAPSRYVAVSTAPLSHR